MESLIPFFVLIYVVIATIVWFGNTVEKEPPGTSRDVVLGAFWPIWAIRGLWRGFWIVWRE